MKKFLSLVLALTMMMSLVTINAGAKEFTDDEELNYKEAVDVISEISVVDGYEDGSFKPQNTLTRGAAAKIICNLILGPTTAAELHADTAPYKDVPVSNTFSGYIAYCAKEGIISGYADGSFRPAGTLTGYAFMKMLLGALGYDATYEGYTGGNWSINVAKQAIGIGLNKGLVDEFNGVDFVTREEAALYAFNTLKATMVDYDQKITTNVNGVDVTISQGNAKPVTWTEGINEDGNIKDDDFVQFAEEFFPKLVRKDDNDKFMAPANTWVYDKSEIGTYERTDLIVETYTTKVTGKDAYDLLKSGVIKDNDLEVYLDGVVPTGSELFDKDDMVRSNTSKLGATGDGVLTKVYLDTDKDVITFVSINTWLAKATADYSESKEYAPLSVYTGIGTTKTYNVDVEDVANVTDVAKDTFYQVNISKKDNTNGEVVILKDVEVLEDSTVTKFSSSNEGKGTGKVTKLTTGGEEYKANVKAFYDKDVLNEYDQTLLTDNTYNVYVDANGYFIGVELFEGTKNYVFITGFDRNSSNLSVKTATASAIFLDGTMKNIEVNVTDTDKNIGKLTASDHNEEYFIKWSNTNAATWTAAGKQYDDGVYNLNQWYTYTENNGVYTLKPCARMTWTKYPTTPDVSIRTDNLSLVDTEGNKTRVYGEDETVFLTVDLDIVDTTGGVKKAITEVTGVYTGVQNVDIDIDVDDIQAVTEGQVYTVYDSDWYVIGAVVIGEARGATANYAYIISGAKSEEKKDDTYYWEFDAVLGGEKQTLTAKSKYKSTISELAPGTVQELRFDGDYVVSIKDVTKVYTDYRYQVDGEDVYAMRDNKTVNTAGTAKGIMDDPDTLTLQGRTLYVTSARNDVGLGLAAGAKAVTIQDENKETKVATNFSDVASAISHLADASTADGFQYDGEVYAVLNSNGTAEWVVFVNHTALTTGTENNNNQGGGKLYTYNAWTDTFGFVHANVNYSRPAYVPTNDDVAVSFNVYADGKLVGHVGPVNMGAGVNIYNYGAAFASGLNVEPGAKITLDQVEFQPAAINVQYKVNGKVLTGTDLTNKLGAVSTTLTTTASGNAAAFTFTPDTTTYYTGTYNYTISGVSVVSGQTPTLSATGASGATTIAMNNIYATGNGYVTVDITATEQAPVYSITTDQVDIMNGTGYAISNFNDKTGSATANAGDTQVLKIGLTGYTYGDPTSAEPNVNFNVSVDGVKAGIYAYEVSVKIDGTTYTKVLTNTTAANLVTLKLNKNIVINAADITVTPVANTKIVRASYDAGSMALSMVFSNPIDASKVVVDASSTAQVDPSKTPTVAGNTVIVYLLNPPANGNTVVLDNTLEAVDGNPVGATSTATFAVDGTGAVTGVTVA